MPSEERTFSAPARAYNNRLAFSRFKYVEEMTQRLDRAGHPWVMFRDHDKVEVEEYDDGDVETYTFPQYVVLWNE